MKRILPVLVVAIAALGVVGYLVLDGGRSDETSESKTETTEGEGQSRPERRGQKPENAESGEGGDEREMALLMDDDPEGDLRLEGQVVNATQDPVAGALVILDSHPPRRTETESDGSFFFDKLVGRTYNLTARADEGVAGPVVARLSRESEPVILRLAPASSVEVTVVDALEKTPIAGATVELRDVDTQTANTDEAGKATIRPVVPDRYRVVASAPGYAKQHTWLAVAPGEHSSTTLIALKPGAAVSGRVVAPDGAPVAKASVLYSGASEWAQRADQRRDAAITDEDGAFRFDALPAGTFRFTARDDEHAPGTSEMVTLDGKTEVTNVTITMESAAVVRGRVDTLSGEPVASARVRVVVRAEGFFDRGPTRQAYTDEAGTFEIRGLPHKQLDFVALHESGTSETVAVDMEEAPHERELTLVLENTEAISGVVVDTEGDPVEGAQVSAFPDFSSQDRNRGRRFGSSWRLRGFSQELTDSGGTFALRGLEPGKYEIRAMPPGSSGGRRGLFMREGTAAKTGDTDVRIVLEADGAIKGKVVLDSGGSPELFSVSAGGFGGGTPFSTTDGSFELRDLAPNAYTLTIRGAGFTSKQVADIRVDSGQTKDVGTITVVRGRYVAGRVTYNGQPVVEAEVRAGRVIFGDGTSLAARFGGPPGAGGAKEVVTDESGEFVINGLGKGDLVLAADHPRYGRSQAMHLAPSGEPNTGLELPLLAVGALQGKAMNGTEPAASISISVQSQPAYNAQFGVSTGEDGAYRFDRLAPGTYKISALLGTPFTGMRFHSEQVEVISDQTVEKNLGVAGGSVTFTVNIQPKNVETVNMAVVRLVPGTLAVQTASQLEQSISRITDGFSGLGIAFSRNNAIIEGVPPGSYSACVIAYPNELERRAMMAYMEREGERMPVVCQAVVVAESPAEQSASVEIEVPAYVPADSE